MKNKARQSERQKLPNYSFSIQDRNETKYSNKKHRPTQDRTKARWRNIQDKDKDHARQNKTRQAR
jgi:hypothetical protein